MQFQVSFILEITIKIYRCYNIIKMSSFLLMKWIILMAKYKTCQKLSFNYILSSRSVVIDFYLKKNLFYKFNPVLWVHLCYIYTFGADVDFSIFFPGLEFIYSTHRVRTALMKKWTTQNCLTDVNWFSKLFYILLEKPRE